MRLLRPLLVISILLLLVLVTILVLLSQSGASRQTTAIVLPTQMATAALPAALPSITPTPTPLLTLPATFTPAGVTPAPVNTTVAGDEESLVTFEAQATEAVLVAEANPLATAIPKQPTATSTTPTPYVAGEERACPEPSRVKPEYSRYLLSSQPWPTPGAGRAGEHFWLSKPYPGGGRFLINQTYPYGYDLGGRLLIHNAVDSAGGKGTPLLAVADGTVVVAQEDVNELFGWRCNWYGHLVVVELDQRWLGQKLYALYGHVLEISVEVGQRVVRGDQLAEVGFGGAASAPHLHFELRLGSNAFGATRNPMLWIDPATRGVVAGRLVDPQGRSWRGVGLSLIGHFEGASEGNTWTYLEDPLGIVTVNPDEGWAENFVFSDVKPGDYTIFTLVQGEEYRARVTVTAGKVSSVEIVTEAYKKATPAP